MFISVDSVSLLKRGHFVLAFFALVLCQACLLPATSSGSSLLLVTDDGASIGPALKHLVERNTVISKTKGNLSRCRPVKLVWRPPANGRPRPQRRALSLSEASAGASCGWVKRCYAWTV